MFWNHMWGDHDALISWSKILYYLRWAWPRKLIWKRYKGRPRCFETTCGETMMFWYHDPKYYTTSDWLGPGNGFENVMQGDHDVLKPHEGRPRCFDTMVQNIILPQIGLAQEMDLKTLWKETTMFWNPMKGDHDVLIPCSQILYYLRLVWLRNKKTPRR